MAKIDIRNFSFTYPRAEKEALSNLNLSVKEGEFVVICGPSGCGKTTLLYQLKKQLRPRGHISGEIFYDDILIEELSDEKAATEIGIVFQDPESQIVLDTVIHELAFSLENMGYDTGKIRKSVAEMASFFGLENTLYKSIHELSGGQKQILNLASVLLLKPKVLLFDEPTSQLDPIAAQKFLSMIYRINQELSMTIIMTEHRLEDVFALADKVVILDEGKIKYLGTPKEVSYMILDKKDREFEKFLPSIVKLFFGLKKFPFKVEEIPMNVKEAKPVIARILKKDKSLVENREKPSKRKPIIKIKDVFFKYEKDAPLVLKGLSLDIFKGEILTIMGGNGTGKSTLLQVILGLKNPQHGKVLFEGKEVNRIAKKVRFSRIGYLAQNPMLYFVYDTVREEMFCRGERHNKASKDIEYLIERFSLRPLLNRHPYDLSGGEKQKLAMAIVLLSEPEVLLLDEPTKGVDPNFKEDFKKLLEDLQKSKVTIVMVTHDIEFAAKISTRCALIFDGKVACEASPRTFFSKNYFYTTSINRVVRDKIPEAIVVEDVIQNGNTK